MRLPVTLSVFASLSFLPSVFATNPTDECPAGYEKSKKLNWVNCPIAGKNEQLQCATLEVPLDWTQKDTSDKLRLRLVRQPASSPTAKSIIVNPGGPGESGLEMVIDSGDYWQGIAGDFNIVSFDPRGVGLTNPYACPEIENTAGYTNTDEGIESVFNHNKNQGAKCAESAYREAGSLVGTAFVARDINAITEALGEDGLIRYWGKYLILS